MCPLNYGSWCLNPGFYGSAPLDMHFHPLSTTETNCHCSAASNCLRRSSHKEEQRPTTAAQRPSTVSGDHLSKKLQLLTISCQQASRALLKLGKRPKKLAGQGQPPSTSRRLSPHTSRPQCPTDMTNLVDC